MSTLLDTNVLSVLFNVRRHPQHVVERIEGLIETSSTSALCIGEIERGIVLAQTSDPTFAKRLQLWSAELQNRYRTRILPFGTVEALAWGRLTALLGNRNPDLQIAATALVHGMTVITRNVGHFEATGVRVINPWSPA